MEKITDISLVVSYKMSFLGPLKYSAPFKISYIVKLMYSDNFTILNKITHFITKYFVNFSV